MATAIENKPPIPLRVFPERPHAEKWQAELIEYHVSPPVMPTGDDAGDWKDYEARMLVWRRDHPAGIDASHYQRFGLYEVPSDQ